MKTVFNTANVDYAKQPLFLGESLGIARYDNPKYPFFDKITEKQLGFFWRADEIDCTRDSKDFRSLTEHEQHIFTSNLKRQILLDSVQGRSPSQVLGNIASQPELEIWLQTWSFFETIHSKSYTHIIRNVYTNPSEVFDSINSIALIEQCANDISKYYDRLILSCEVGTLFEKKTSLWNCLMAINILEGVRFYVSFACSWAFAELKKMEGNAKIIKLIARDENIHLASTQQMLKMLVAEDKDFAKIQKQNHDLNVEMYKNAVDQEIRWAEYLFENGSMIGLNLALLTDYIEWIANKRMMSVNLVSPYKGGANPLPWTQKWISGSEVQVAPQETQISTYIVGGVNNDVTTDSFKEFKL